MKKTLVLLPILSAIIASGAIAPKTNTNLNKDKLNYYLNNGKGNIGGMKAGGVDPFIQYLSTIPGISIYSEHIEFNTTIEPSIITFVQMWNTYMPGQEIPTNVSKINVPQYLGNNTWTSNTYYYNARKVGSESLNFVVAHNPSVADTTVVIESGVTTNTSIGFGFGVYCEGSWAVSADLEASFGISVSSSKQISETDTYPLARYNLSAGKYEVFLDYYVCDKFFFQYNNAGYLTKVGLYSNCPLPSLQHSFHRIGDL